MMERNRPYGGGFIYAINDYTTEERLRDQAQQRLNELKAQAAQYRQPKPWYRQLIDYFNQLRNPQ